MATPFLEAHELAFCFFRGVFRKLRYDNLTAAVKKIFQGYRREETARFIAFRSHWRFTSEFCTPAEAHEKGGVEGEAGYFRRNHWVPVPEASDLTDLTISATNSPNLAYAPKFASASDTSDTTNSSRRQPLSRLDREENAGSSA